MRNTSLRNVTAAPIPLNKLYGSSAKADVASNSFSEWAHLAKNNDLWRVSKQATQTKKLQIHIQQSRTFEGVSYQLLSGRDTKIHILSGV